MLIIPSIILVYCIFLYINYPGILKNIGIWICIYFSIDLIDGVFFDGYYVSQIHNRLFELATPQVILSTFAGFISGCFLYKNIVEFKKNGTIDHSNIVLTIILAMIFLLRNPLPYGDIKYFDHINWVNSFKSISLYYEIKFLLILFILSHLFLHFNFSSLKKIGDKTILPGVSLILYVGIALGIILIPITNYGTYGLRLEGFFGSEVTLLAAVGISCLFSFGVFLINIISTMKGCYNSTKEKVLSISISFFLFLSSLIGGFFIIFLIGMSRLG